MSTGKQQESSNNDVRIEMEPTGSGIQLKNTSASGFFTNITEQIMRGPLAPINKVLDTVEAKIKHFGERHNRVLKLLICLLLCIGFVAYVVAACVINFERARVLLYLAVIAAVCFKYCMLKKYVGHVIVKNFLNPIRVHFIDRFWKCIKWGFIILFIAFVIFWIAYDTAKNSERLISLAGLFVYMIIGFLFSTNRNKIKWRPILWGFLLQFVFGLLILRTDVGFQVFKWIGDRVAILLGFSSDASAFFFRGLPQFAFIILPIIAYFSALIYLLWYFGIINVVIVKLGWVFQMTMGTTPGESVSAAGNIFLGMVISPLLIRPFLAQMTESELHAIMTGGFATIAGSVLGTYIYLFGISATHLISASVMSAPAALAMSKLMCPEVEEPVIKSVDNIRIQETEEKNAFEAAAVGASMSISLIANVVVNLIAFISLLACANSILAWLGSMVGEPALSFEFICSYLFMPFAYIMGVSWDDSFKVAELFGIKTFLNEFVAYQRLSMLIRSSKIGIGPTLSTRSQVIATYALCGFANIGSMGFTIGGLSALVPSKRTVFAKHVVRAMVAGTLACFMTACIAGLLYEEKAFGPPIMNFMNRTMATNGLLNTTISP